MIGSFHSVTNAVLVNERRNGVIREADDGGFRRNGRLTYIKGLFLGLVFL